MITGITIINYVIYILMGAVFARVLLSWIIPIQPSIATNPIITFVFQITEPILAPIRRVLPPMGMLDLSPMIALLLLSLLQVLVSRLA